MLVAFVKITVAESDRQTALSVLLAEIPIVQAMTGCLTFRVLLDPVDSETLLVLHEWEHQDNFNAYLSSPGFAKVNSILGPMFTEPAISRRFDARLIQQLN
jgi:quinol monooxygenase YgiN